MTFTRSDGWSAVCSSVAWQRPKTKVAEVCPCQMKLQMFRLSAYFFGLIELLLSFENFTMTDVLSDVDERVAQCIFDKLVE